MAKCRNCGKEIGDQAAICPNCGTPVASDGGFAWGILGCCIPIAGLILYLVWKDTKPKSAKAAGIGALVCVILGIAWYVLMMVIAIGGGMASGV